MIEPLGRRDREKERERRRLAILFCRVSRSSHESTRAPRLRFIHEDPGRRERREEDTDYTFPSCTSTRARRRIDGCNSEKEKARGRAE